MKKGILILLMAVLIIPVRGQEDLFLAGRAEMRKGNYGEAARLLQEALKENP
jgi:Flp pilus assembly protein TadD